MRPIAKQARDLALTRIRSYLRGRDVDDFRNGDAFADAVFEEIQTAYQGSFTSASAKKSIKRGTKEYYTFYRLRDRSAFPEGSDVTLKFGGPDTRALNFFNKLDGFYFSSYVDNSRDSLSKWLREEYLEKGAALFGRGTGEDLDDFRVAAGGKLDKINDYAVQTIVESSVQRIRNYAHIGSLRQGRFKRAKIVATLDERTSPICRYLDGKFINIGPAAETVERLTKLAPGDYALELYKDKLGRAFATNPVEYVKDRIDDDGLVHDSLVREGRGFPPFHPKCRTRVEGVFES